VPEEQLSLAIGRRGQNVRLASSLCGWNIDILTEDQESERRQKEFQERTSLFMEALDVDELLSQLLVTEGFTDVNELADVELKEISNIAGFDEDTAEEIQARAADFLNKENKELEDKCKKLKISDDLLSVEELSLKMIVALGENDVKNLEDFAYCSSDDLLGWDEVIEGEKKREEGILEGFDIKISEANDLIMSARIKLGIIPDNTEETNEVAAGDDNEADNSLDDIV
jgi:N utilization substance protein A